MPLSSGKLAILMIVFVAVIGVVTSGLFHWNQQHEAVRYWGRNAALLIAQAPKMDALLLGPASSNTPPGESFSVDGKTWVVLQRKDASHAPGFSNLRASLLASASFAWTQPFGDCQPEWQYGLEFHGEGKNAIVLFAPNCLRTTLAGSDRTIALVPRMRVVPEMLKSLFPSNDEPPSAEKQ